MRSKGTRREGSKDSCRFWPVQLLRRTHYSHGPDWIPLFFLALGLGYLYRQTHRLLPCITVHFLLNSCSMGGFLVSLLSK